MRRPKPFPRPNLALADWGDHGDERLPARLSKLVPDELLKLITLLLGSTVLGSTEGLVLLAAQLACKNAVTRRTADAFLAEHPLLPHCIADVLLTRDTLSSILVPLASTSAAMAVCKVWHSTWLATDSERRWLRLPKALGQPQTARLAVQGTQEPCAGIVALPARRLGLACEDSFAIVNSQMEVEQTLFADAMSATVGEGRLFISSHERRIISFRLDVQRDASTKLAILDPDASSSRCCASSDSMIIYDLAFASGTAKAGTATLFASCSRPHDDSDDAVCIVALDPYTLQSRYIIDLQRAWDKWGAAELLSDEVRAMAVSADELIYCTDFSGTHFASPALSRASPLLASLLCLLTSLDS